MLVSTKESYDIGFLYEPFIGDVLAFCLKSNVTGVTVDCIECKFVITANNKTFDFEYEKSFTVEHNIGILYCEWIDAMLGDEKGK